MAMPADSEWPAAYARVQRLAEQDLMKLLWQAYKDIDAQIKEILRRPVPATISDVIRIEQLKLIQRNMIREQARLWRQLGDVIRARRLEAAAAASNLGSAIDEVLLRAVGEPELARQLKASFAATAEQTIETTVARITLSALPLSERIYLSNVWVNQRVQNLINSALLRGLSAAEFAKEARAWFDPGVPGGTRYAAMRLARTEINNAFHATSVREADDKPWIDSMKWHLSRSHPKVDICDLLAKGGAKGDGVYPPRDVPRKPHPQDMCYVTPISPDEDEWIENFAKGRYDNYIDSKISAF